MEESIDIAFCYWGSSDMKYDDFLNYILSFDRVLFLEDEKNKIINRLCSIADVNDIHYLWSNYNSPQFVAQKNIT